MLGNVVLLFWPGDHPRWCGAVLPAVMDKAWIDAWAYGYQVHHAPIEDET